VPTRNDVNGGILAALESSFERIARESMLGLPFYNEALAVEAVFFRPFGAERLGVLVTPWFMNLMLIPETPVPFDSEQIGARRTIALPGGEATLTAGGDEDFGMYYSYSFVSPMDRFGSQAQARAAAQSALARLLAPPSASAARETGDDGESASRPSRRTLFAFRGRPSDGAAPPKP
jgi:[NiFe] hydrogenase assembly HybE family chaperone